MSARLVTWRSHRGHRGRGRLPSSKITTVSWTCRCTKCTRIAACVADTPGHPSTGHCLLPSFAGKLIFLQPGLPSRLGVPEVPPCCGLPMSSNHVTQHGSSCDFRPTLPARHSLYLTLLECFTDPRQPLTVTCRSPVDEPRPIGVTCHADCLVDVSPQAYPVEDGYQGAESALDPGRVQRDEHPVVCIKHRQLVSSLPSCLSLLHNLCHQPLYPVPDDRVHYHIENCGGQRVALRNPPSPLKGLPIVAACSHHYG